MVQEVNLGAEGLVPFEVHAGRGVIWQASQEVETGPVASFASSGVRGAVWYEAPHQRD